MKTKISQVRSFKPDEDLDQLLDKAMQATGRSRQDIINEALRRHAPEIISELITNQDAAREELSKLLPRFQNQGKKGQRLPKDQRS